MHFPTATNGTAGKVPAASATPPEISAGPSADGSSIGGSSSGGGGPVAALRGVVFGYEPGTPVVRSVSVELRPGRVCALIGPNAAGKSTLLKLMLGQLDPWEGTAELAGRPVLTLTPRHRAARVSYVPQQGAVSFAFTVGQVVAMGRYALGDAGAAVEHALEVCDLYGLRDRVFAHLSGGQQQRVLLARAVAQSAGAGRVMLLDEPASGMDLWHVHQTMRLLTRLAQAGAHGGGTGEPGGPGVLVVLHDVNLAARYADDIWLMDRGELVAAGPWREVMQPKLLEAVYSVRFQPMQQAPAPKPAPGRRAAGSGEASGPRIPGAGTNPDQRPVFWIDPADTIE